MSDPTPTFVPRVAEQHPDVYPGSPVALCGLFTAVLQAHFLPRPSDSAHPDLALPWYWDPTPTPTDDGGGALPTDTEETAQPARRLYIERAQEFPDARDMLPALFIGRGPITAARDHAGHRVDFSPHNDASQHTCMLQVPLSIDCHARNLGESENLADHVFHFLLTTQAAICGNFGLYSIEPPTINTAEIIRRSSANIEAWNTTVYTQVMFQVHWRRWQLAPMLNEIRTAMATNGQLSSLRVVLQRRPAG